MTESEKEKYVNMLKELGEMFTKHNMVTQKELVQTELEKEKNKEN